MNVFKMAEVNMPAEELTEEGWVQSIVESQEALVLTNLTEEEHDFILDLVRSYDPNGLRGFNVTLHVFNKTADDPASLNLLSLPIAGQILRHQDNYYRVELVVQSTNYGAAVFAHRVCFNELLKEVKVATTIS